MSQTLTSALVLAFLTATTAGAQSAADVGRGPAPEGFSWQVLKEIKAVFLLPDGWYFRVESKNGTDAYFLTKENIEEVGLFQTGLSINAIEHIDRKTGQTAYEYARRFIKVRGESGLETIDSTADFRSGVFRGTIVRSSAQRPDGGRTIMHSAYVANTKTQRFYLIMFESPAESWDEAWIIGEKIMQTYRLDKGV